MISVKAIQQDFGGFDLRFPGISITIETQRAYELLFNWPSVGVLPVDCAGDPEAALETILAATTLTHELRHFHDHLLAPLGGILARYRLTALLNFLQLVHMMARRDVWGEANCLPRPLPRWVRMNTEDRARKLTGWDTFARGRGIGPHVVPNLPYDPMVDLTGLTTRFGRKSPTMLASLFLVITGYYERIVSLFTNPSNVPSYFDFQPMHLSEASAIIVQQQEIWSAFGERALELFMASLDGTPYDRAFSAVNAVASHQRHASAGIHSAIVTWCLLGNYHEEGSENAAPVSRFSRLSRLLLDEGIPTGDLDVRDLYRAWDTSLGCTDTLQGIRASLSSDEAFLKKLRRDQEQAPLYDANPALFQEVISYWKELESARRHTAERFLASPEDYVDPYRYLATMDSWSWPPVKYVFKIPGLRPLADELKNRGFLIYLAKQATDGSAHAYEVGVPTRSRAPKHISEELAFNIYNYLGVCDVLFSELRCDLDDVSDDLAKSLFPNVRLRNLFS